MTFGIITLLRDSGHPRVYRPNSVTPRWLDNLALPRYRQLRSLAVTQGSTQSPRNISRPENAVIDLSYVVPAHNVARFIGDCLNSLMRSAGLTCEIVVIDDRSTDATMEVARKMAAENDQFRFVFGSTQEHDEYRVGGLGAARNLGVALASGRYLSFVDSDDWIDARAYASVVSLLDRDGADFAWLRAITYNQRSSEFTPFNDEALYSHTLDGRASIVTNLNETPALPGFEPSSCNRIYRASFFRQCVGPFPMNLLYEDLPTHFRALQAASRILITSVSGYYYRINRPGQITGRNDEKRFDFVKILDLISTDSQLRHLSPQAGAAMIAYLVDFAFWCVTSVAFPLRQRFVDEIAAALRRFPAEWTGKVLGKGWGDDKKSFKLWLLSTGRARDVSLLRTGITDPRTSFRFYLDTGRKHHARIAVTRRARDVAVHLSRRFK